MKKPKVYTQVLITASKIAIAMLLLITALPTLAGDGEKAGNEAIAGGEEKAKKIPFEKHYVGKHKLGVNRVNSGKRVGEAKIFREANALVLEAKVEKGLYHLSLNGIVSPVSKKEFVLEGTMTGAPDTSFRGEEPTERTTEGRFTFRATKGRKFWRLYEVDGKECVCNDGCGNDFCYVDLSFR